MKTTTYLSLLFILIIAILLRVHIINNIHINSFITEPLLFTDLLGRGITIPWRLIFLLDLLNIFLLFLIGKKILDARMGLLASLLYGILPWMVYVQLMGSLNIFLVFFLLLFFYGLFLAKETWIGLVLMITSSIVLILSALSSWFILPVLIFGIYTTDLMKQSYLRIYTFMMFIGFLLMTALSFHNLVGLKNVYINQIGIFSDPGFKNSINAFQGESKETGFGYLSKWSENKYIYFSKYLILKSFKNIAPATYFTSQEKLYNFSFSPPIYVGLLIPFLYGFYLVIRTRLKFFYLTFLVLIVPSIVSKQLVDLSRLVIFAPVMIFLISFGLIKLYQEREKYVFSLFLYLSIFLVLFQMIITFSDIQFREPLRYKLSIGQDFIMDKR